MEHSTSDSGAVGFRGIESSDADRLMRFHEALSTETIRRRYFSRHPHLKDSELVHLTSVDHVAREAVVAIVDDEIVAVGRYERLDDPSVAEVAFVVADPWQGKGLGHQLLQRLAEAATAVGIRSFVADSLVENRRMLGVFLSSGFVVRSHTSDGVTTVEIDL